MFYYIMDNQALIQLYAKAYNTLMEMAWTFQDENLPDDLLQSVIRLTDEIDNCVMESKQFSKAEKDEFVMFTDQIQNRIYFNL